jgi:hypothetical protein
MSQTHDIFLSYSHQDYERVQKLLKLLKSQDWSVWFDERIRSGTEFDQEIENALSTAKCVVIVWSRHSINSSWVRAEAEQAFEAQKLVPICIDPNTKIPLHFQQIQTAMIFDLDERSKKLERFLSDIQYVITTKNVYTEAEDGSEEQSDLVIVPGKWTIETKVLFGLLRAVYRMELKPNGDVFGNAKMGIFGGDFSGHWRFSGGEAQLYLNVTGSMGHENWTLNLKASTEDGFRAKDNHGRDNIIRRVY